MLPLITSTHIKWTTSSYPFFFTGKFNFNIWSCLVAMLSRPSPVVMHMSSRILSKLSTLSRRRCPSAELLHFLTWLKEQLTMSNANGTANEFVNRFVKVWLRRETRKLVTSRCSFIILLSCHGDKRGE